VRKGDQTMRNKPLTVGDVARRSGLAVSAIHFYEREGLIEGWRSSGNQRRYAREVLRRIAVIRVAQLTGIPLAEVRQALAELPAKRTPNNADWEAISSRWRVRLTERIEQLIRLRDKLDGCIGCGCLSLSQCPLRNPEDRLAEQGPGPRYLLSTGEG